MIHLILLLGSSLHTYLARALHLYAQAVAKVKIMDSTYAELKLVSSWVPESDIRVREVYQKGSLEFPDLGSEEMMGVCLANVFSFDE